MKKIWYGVPVAVGVIAVLMGAAPEGAAPFKSPGKTGLWVSTRHSNMPLFLAPPKTPEAMAARSQEMLNLPGKPMTTCMNAASQQKFIAPTAASKDCNIQAVETGEGTATIDGICLGTPVHQTLTFRPADRVLLATHFVVDSATNPERGGVTDVTFESPEHITITTTLRRQYLGVAMKDVFDLRWQSADCGALAPGQTNPPATPVAHP